MTWGTFTTNILNIRNRCRSRKDSRSWLMNIRAWMRFSNEWNMKRNRRSSKGRIITKNLWMFWTIGGTRKINESRWKTRKKWTTTIEQLLYKRVSSKENRSTGTTIRMSTSNRREDSKISRLKPLQWTNRRTATSIRGLARTNKNTSVNRRRRKRGNSKSRHTTLVLQRIRFYCRCMKNSDLIRLKSRNKIKTQCKSGRTRDVTRKWKTKNGKIEQNNRWNIVRCWNINLRWMRISEILSFSWLKKKKHITEMQLSS